MTLTSPSNMLWDLLLAQPHDEESIMQCLYDHPDCCSLVIDDKLAIHVAIEQGLSVDIIKQMLICYPAWNRKNRKGRVLLHELLLNVDRIISLCIHLIIDANVEAVRTVDRDGNLPVHIECYNHCRYDIITKLLDIYPDAISMKGDYDSYPLRLAITSDHSSSEVISYLINAYPDAVRIPDDNGHLPVHVECNNHCRYDVVTKLLNIYPDAINIMDEIGCYPLHCAIMSDHSTYVAISLLTSVSPGAVSIKNKDGDLPLHMECDNHCRYDVIKNLLDIYPDAISIVDLDGRYPLHLAFGCRHSTVEVISYLIDAYPDIVRMRDVNGDLPLHIECEYRCRYEVIIKLLGIYPDAINTNGVCGRYSLHCALESKHSSYEVISHLIDVYPDAVHIEDDNGNLPLHIECDNECRYDFIVKLYHGYPVGSGIRNAAPGRISYDVKMPILPVIIRYYKSYVGVHPSISSYSSKQAMQYKALVTSMIDTCCSYHVARNNNFNIMDYINLNHDDPIQYRLLLNLAVHHLGSTSSYMSAYHDRNYHHRAHLLYHIYLLSSSCHMKPPSYKYSDMYDGSLYAVLLSMLAAAGRLHLRHDSTHDHVDDMKYGWMKGDDIGCVLLRKAVLYL